MAASGELKERIQLLQAAKARADAVGKSLRPDAQRELDSYRDQGLLGANTGGHNGSGAKPTEGQAKAVGFLTRALGANEQFEKGNVAPRGVVAQGVVDVLPTSVANSMTSDERQVSENAQRDFVTATLRQESGAAISAGEYDNQRQTFFPQPGDGQAVIKAKAAARRRAVQGLIAAAGPVVGDDLKSQYADYFPQSHAKGGDPTSGAPGAGDGSVPPPDGPGRAPPGTELKFNDELPDQVHNAVTFTDQQKASIAALVQSGASADQLNALYRSYGTKGLSDEQWAPIIKFYSDPKNRDKAPVVGDVDNAVKPVDAGDGAAGAFARGVGNAGTLGFLDEAGAVADTVLRGGTYAENLDTRRGQELFDQQQHGVARFGGQVLGGLPAGGIEFAGARAAARTAGVAALRGGLSREVALMQANRAFAMRSALEGAGLGAAYGFGNAEGGLGDRVAGGLEGGAFGGVVGGALPLAGGAVANKRALAAIAARTAEPSESAQLAQAAEEQGIRLLPQDVANGPGIGRATAGAAQTPFGTNTVRARANEAYDSFRDRVSQLAGGPRQSLAEVGGPIRDASAKQASRNLDRASRDSQVVVDQLGPSPDITGAGQLIQRGASKWLRDSSEKATKLYDRIDIPSNFDAKLDNTRSALKEITTGFESNKALSGLWVENPRLKATLEALTPSQNEEGQQVGGNLAWADLKRFRSIIGEIVGRPGLEADGNQIAALRKLYGGVSEDMRQTAQAAGGNAYNQFTRANGYFAARANRVRDTVSKILGDDTNATAGEAYGAVESALKDSASGDPGFARRALAQLPEEDANAVRSAIVTRARGGAAFDPKRLASSWAGISERGKSILLPKSGLRSIMDDAAERAASSAHDPLEGKSSEQVYLALERAAETKGNSASLAKTLNGLSPEEAQAVRTLFVHRLGLSAAGAQNAEGDAFSAARFLTRWNTMTPESRATLFGNGKLRDDLTTVAKLAERVKASERLAGHSNTGAVNSFNATTGGLGGAAIAFLTGHPVVAAGLALPAAYQRVSAEVLTSPRLLNWLARAPKKPNLAAQRAHIRVLSSIAKSEPAIAQDVLSLQRRLSDAFAAAPARLAAQERDNSGGVANGQAGQDQPPSKQFQP
jgi:hypothetical protein